MGDPSGLTSTHGSSTWSDQYSWEDQELWSDQYSWEDHELWSDQYSWEDHEPWSSQAVVAGLTIWVCFQVLRNQIGSNETVTSTRFNIIIVHIVVHVSRVDAKKYIQISTVWIFGISVPTLQLMHFLLG